MSSRDCSDAASKIPSLSNFLSHHRLKQQQQQEQHSTRHYVTGNEAGDADSIMSAIALAYVANNNSNNMTPLVSIPKSDLETQRPETLLLLELAGITPNELLYVDQVQRTLDETVQLTLVDHNRLNDRLRSTGARVVEILDHHLDEGHHLDTCSSQDCSRRNIAFANDQALVASTCTLVTEQLLKSTFYHPPYPAALSVLLLGTILLDSVNLLPEAGKVTPRDRAAIHALIQNTDWQELSSHAQEVLRLSSATDSNTSTTAVIGPNTTALYEALQNAKFDAKFWKSLSVRDALRLDYKQFVASSQNGKKISFGVSTVLLSQQDFFADRNGKQTTSPIHWPQEVRRYMDELGVLLLGIMFAFVDNDDNTNKTKSSSGSSSLHRQLFVCCDKEDAASLALVDGLVQFLMQADHNADALQLVELGSIGKSGNLIGSGSCNGEITNSHDSLHVRLFEQGNVKASRKQVVPLFFEYLESGRN